MAFGTNNLLLHIKRAVYTSIRLGYESASEYPVVLGIGILLLFLYKLCPSLITFLLSSSPVFLLTALLLGALLSYGEPSSPVIGEETLENQKKSPPKSEISVTDFSVEKVQNVDVTRIAKSFESSVVCIEERTSDILVHDTHRDEENAIYVSADIVLCDKTSELTKNKVTVKREEHVEEICEKVELQQIEGTTTERCQYEVNNQYQFGELMSACWQPVMRQEPVSDSESDLTESSDASITDIIPMLDELNLPVNLGTDDPTSTFRDNLNSLSDDDENDSEEDGDLSSDEDRAEEKKDDRNNWKDFMDPSSSDTENNTNLESLMERQKAKNILKFELDRRLMNMQAADAIQIMEEASRFRVQVPSISTPRPNSFDPSKEETVELPQIPDSAPSVLLPWRKPFDIPFNQIVGCDSRLQETWTPRSCVPSKQRRKHESLYFRQSTHLRHQNSMNPEKPEVSEKDVDNHSDSDSEQEWNNGKLFGSLEPHVGDEIKILSAAISDVCVLEVNHGINEGTKSTDTINGTGSFYIQKSISSTSEANDSVSAGCEQLLSCSVSEEYNTEKHIVEADSICEVNSLFKCRMEEVLVQSLSESGIDQPLTGKLEHELDDTLSTESAMSAIEARSVEGLNSQFAQLNGEALLCAVSDTSCDDEPIQDSSSEALPVENGHTSELPTKDGHSYPTLDNPMDVNIECKSKEMLTEDTELPVLEASSAEEMNSLFRQLEDEAPAQMPRSPDLMVGEHNGGIDCGVLVPDACSSECISSAFLHLSNVDDKIKIPGDGEVILDSAELKSGLRVMETNALDGHETSGSDSIKAI